jgi:peptide/nickel transport system permease protein
MRSYIIRRLLLLVPTVFLASLIVFFIIRLIPGSVVDIMVSEMQFATEMDRVAIEKALGLDVPIHIQYVRWMGNILLHGDFGKSLWSGTPVLKQIADRWPVTLELGLLGLIVAQVIALPIGIYSALRQDTWGD